MGQHLSTETSLAEYIDTQTQTDLPQVTHVIGLTTDLSPSEAFEILTDNLILSAPVYDCSADARKYIGFLTVQALADYLVFKNDHTSISSTSPLPKSQVKLPPSSQNNINQLGFNSKHPTTTLSTLARMQPYKAIPESKNSIWQVILTLRSKSTKRVPVINTTGQIVNIISQSSILQFLFKELQKHNHDDVLQAFTNQRISTLHMGTSPVVTCPYDMKVLDCARVLSRRKLSAVAIIDAQGVLVANFSCHDLQAWTKLILASKTASTDEDDSKRKRSVLLNQGVYDFLVRQSPEMRGNSSSLKTQPYTPTDCSLEVVTVSNRDTIGTTLEKLAMYKLHRVFRVDDVRKPVEVISLTDLLTSLVKYAQTEVTSNLAALESYTETESAALQ
jgi:CBS-domain-containing membrane protein